MASGREMHEVLVHGGQALFTRRLFEPELKDLMGQPLQNPRYSVVVRFPKTQPNWWDERPFRSLAEACMTIQQREMAGAPYIEYPVRDGDRPNRKGKVPDWAKGHWTLQAGTTFRDTLQVMQHVNGLSSELPSLSHGGYKIWGDGDICVLRVSIAKRATDNVGIKAYLNGIIFIDKGEAVNFGGRLMTEEDWRNAVNDARQMGIAINQNMPQGFTGVPSFGAPQHFGAPQYPPPQQFGAPQYAPPQQFGAPPQQPQFGRPQQQAFGAPQFQPPQRFEPQQFNGQQPPQNFQPGPAFGAPQQPYGQAPQYPSPPARLQPDLTRAFNPGQAPGGAPGPNQLYGAPPQQPPQYPSPPARLQSDLTQAFNPGAPQQQPPQQPPQQQHQQWNYPPPDDDIPF